MQVLIALARAGGEPVSRETLIEVCWGDVTVGEDALNRCVQRLRRLADSEACGAFAIETIPRIGYRLAAGGDVASPKPTFAQPLLAVLAFDNLSGDPDFLYFSDGVSEEIQQTVARRADLKVVGRTSSFQFRGQDKAVGRVAAELGATHVLDGSVRRSGQRVRISAQLIDCGSRTTLWADRFDRELTDIFAVQDEIATKVALALDAALASAADIGKIDPTAYDLYLKSRAVRGGRHVPITEAIRLLERAVSLAPRTGDCLGGAGGIIGRRQIGGLGVDEIDIVVDRTEVVAAAEAALRLDPGCGLAYVALGTLLPFGDYQGREAALERALAVGPRSSLTASRMGWFLASVGRNQEALQYAAQGLELDPLDEFAANAYSQLLTYVGRYDDSQRSYAVFREKWPLSPLFTIAPLNHAHLHGDRQTYDMLRRIAVDLGMSGKFVRQALASGDMRFDPTPRSRERIIEAIDGQIRNTGDFGRVRRLDPGLCDGVARRGVRGHRTGLVHPSLRRKRASACRDPFAGHHFRSLGRPRHDGGCPLRRLLRKARTVRLLGEDGPLAGLRGRGRSALRLQGRVLAADSGLGNAVGVSFGSICVIAAPPESGRTAPARGRHPKPVSAIQTNRQPRPVDRHRGDEGPPAGWSLGAQRTAWRRGGHATQFAAAT